MNIKNAIFDLDGTLIDSMLVWRSKQMQIIQERYHITISEDLYNQFIRLNDHRLVKIISEHYGVVIDKSEVASASEHLMEPYFWEGRLAVKPYVKEFFDDLKSRGCGIALSTATPHRLCEPYLKKVGLWDYFDCIYTTEDCGGISKRRSPAVYDLSLAALGGTKENTAVFEDVLSCMETCKNAGYYTIAVADTLQEKVCTGKTSDKDYDFGTIDQIKKLADRYILSYKELLDE